ncbi:MAG: class I tRNA ligase family protein [Myxococcota bacterium]
MSARINRWILARLGTVMANVNQAFDVFRFDDSTLALYHFFWGELCDWYLELTKPVFAGDDEALKAETRLTLAYALRVSLEAIHPFMPFITEELWQRIPKAQSSAPSVCIAPYPSLASGRPDPTAVQEMELVKAVIGAARAVRSEREVHPGASVPLTLRSDDPKLRALLDSERTSIATLVKAEPITIEEPGGERPAGAALAVAEGVEVLVLLKGIVDGAKEAARIERQIAKTDKDIAAISKKLGAKGFVDRAPAEVVEESRAQLAKAQARRKVLEEGLVLAAELN